MIKSLPSKIARLIFTALFILTLLPKTAFAQGDTPPIPDPIGYVSDFCHECSAEQLALLEEKLSKLEQETGAEVAVVTVETCGSDGKRYRGEMFNQWGIGKKGSDNGLLILVCLNEGNLEQETGLRMEGVIPDILAFKAGSDYFMPLAENGKICEGLIALVDYYDPIIRGDVYVHAEPSSVQETATQDEFPWGTVLLVVVILALFLIVAGVLLSGDGGTTTEWYPTTPQTHTYQKHTYDTSPSPRISMPSAPRISMPASKPVSFGGGISRGGGATVHFGKK